MNQTAIYARVSVDRQVQEETINSQLLALRERAQADGEAVTDADVYADGGFSGSTLIRPALERLRDRAAEGRLDRLYIYHPDRLARRAAHQALLVEEFARAGVEVVFLKGGNPETAEGALLVQIQGIIAEYERANIMERTRRGKVHRARAGQISVMSRAPYGYRYIPRSEEGGGRLEPDIEEAQVLQRIFHEFVSGRRPLHAIAAGLTRDGIPTRTGKRRWAGTTLWAMLKNPVYMGLAAFGKTRQHRTDRPAPRGRRTTSKRGYVRASVRIPEQEWIRIPVPALVSEEMFAQARDRLIDNQRFALRNATNGRYLLRGLVVCALCRYSWHGMTTVRPPRPHPGPWAYYRCRGRYVPGDPGSSTCPNPPIRAAALERVVWESACEYLQDPKRVVDEFRRRQSSPSEEASVLATQREAADRAVRKHEHALRRLIDAYEVGILTLDEMRPRLQAVRDRVRLSQEHLRNIEQRIHDRHEWEEVVTRVGEFADRVQKGLASLDAVERQQLLRLIIDRIEIGPEEIKIVYRVPFKKPGSATPRSDAPSGAAAAPDGRAVG